MGFPLIESRVINNSIVDGFYGNLESWFTRTQIGQALGYDNPQNAITLIHRRHKERLDLFSRWCQLDTPSGVQQGYVYSFRGVLEICRWSKQPKADMVTDALYDMAESVKTKGYYATITDEELITHLVTQILDSGKSIGAGDIERKYHEIVSIERQQAVETMTGFLIKRNELYAKYKQNTELSEFSEELKELSNEFNFKKEQFFKHLSVIDWSMIQRECLKNQKSTC